MMTRQPNPPSNKPSGDAPETPARQKRRGRWLWLGGIVVFLVLVIGLAPYWLSTGLGRGLAVRVINTQLRGRAELDGLSLSWTGPIRLQGLRLYDPQGQPVVDTREVVLSMGLWGAFTAPERFGDVALDSPQIVLKPGEEETFTLNEALPKPSAEQRDKPPSQPRGSITVRNAMVRMVKLDGSELTVRNINGEVDLETLGNLTGAVRADFDSGGALSVDFDVSDLTVGGEFQPASAIANVTVRTTEDLNLQPVMRFATGQEYPAGTLGIDGTLSYGPEGGEAKLSLTATEFSAGEAFREQVRPMDASVTTDLSIRNQRLTGTMLLNSDAGEIRADLDIPAEADAWAGLGDLELLPVVLEGRGLNLPEFSIGISGTVDAARLGEAVPDLLQLRPDARIVAGQVSLRDVRFTGGTDPSSSGGLQLRGFRALIGEGEATRQAAWEPFDLGWNVAIRDGAGLDVKNLALQADFATIEAQGTPREGVVTFSADGKAMHEQLAEVFDLGGTQWTGTLSGRLDASAVADRPGEYEARLRATGRNLTITEEEKTRGLKELTLDMPLRLRLREGLFDQIGMDDGSMVLNRAIRMRLDMAYDAQQQQGRGTLRSDGPVRLSAVGDLARSLGADMQQDLGGTMAWDVSLQAGGQNPATFRADLRAMDLAVDGRRLQASGEEMTLAVNDGLLDRQGGTVTVGSVALDAGSLATLTAESIEVSDLDARHARATGRYDLQADIGRVMRVLDAFSAKQQEQDPADRSRTDSDPPSLEGRLSASGNIRTDNGIIVASQEGEVKDLIAGRGASAVRYETITWNELAHIDPQNENMEIRSFRLSGDLLDVMIKPGSGVRKFRTERLLDIRGDFEGQWDRIMPLLYALQPSLRSEVGLSLEGSMAPTSGDVQGGTFTITGPAHQPTVKPVFRGVDGRTAVGWNAGRLVGLNLGAGRFSPRMEKGRLYVEAEPIPASEGTLNLGGFVDFTGDEAVFHLPGSMKLVDQVQINPEVGEKLLSRINPIFSRLAGLDGELTITLKDIALPLGDSIKTTGRGSGSLDLRNLRMNTKDGPLATILRWQGVEGGAFEQIGLGRVDFTIQDGRISYRNFRITFGDDYDMIFRGSVRFDDKLEDMFVSLPLTPGLLKRFSLPAAAGDAMGLLQSADLRIEIPIKGTRRLPQLDLANVDVGQLHKQIMEVLLKQGAREGIDRLLEDLLDPEYDRTDAEPPAEDRTDPQNEPAKPESQQRPRRNPGAGALNRLLEGLLRPDDPPASEEEAPANPDPPNKTP